MKKYRIPYGGAMIGTAEKKAITKAVNKNYWPAGEEADKMEKEAAKFLGVKYGILANSGSSAGLLALASLELPRGSEVIVPAVTFPTIFNIILQLGLVPVVVDCVVGTYNLDVSLLESAISDNTRAIICVHAVGNPVDMPTVIAIAGKYNLYVMEDNCDGWGGTLEGRKVGAWGHISFTSFHAAHIVSMGQGGGVFTDDQELARKVRMYRDWGRQSDIPRRTNGTKWKDLPEDYDARFIYEKIGWNLGPLELQAAMGRVQLKKTKKIKTLRKRNFDYLFKHLSKFPELKMPEWNGEPSWFSFPITTTGERGPLVAYLESKGIETRSMFTGNVTKHPCYANIRMRVPYELNGADYILYHSFWISCHPRLTKKDREYIIKAFDDYYKGNIRVTQKVG